MNVPYECLLNLRKLLGSKHGNKNTGILSTKIPLTKAYRNQYLHSCCTLTIMIPEMIPQAKYCKKSHWLDRNGSKCGFRLMYFFQEPQWDLQFIISEAWESSLQTFPIDWFHCVKSAQIRSFFWSVFSCIQSKYRKIRTRKNSVLGHFLRSNFT